MSTDTDEAIVQELHAICVAFRDAIEQCAPATLTPQMAHFPRGACDDTALLLARRLREAGYGPLQLRYARYGHDEIPAGHAWLRLGDIDLDITADQFSDQAAKVIVARASSWHAGLRRVDDQEADYTRYGAPDVRRFDAAYRAIIAAHSAPTR